MAKTYIYRCKNGHHFINSEDCPYCKEKFIAKIEYQLGDCIFCGQLCPSYAIGCTNPNPIEVKLSDGPISN